MKNINNNIIKNNVNNDNNNNVYNNINKLDSKESNINNNNKEKSLTLKIENNIDKNKLNNKILKSKDKIIKDININNDIHTDNINNEFINSNINKDDKELENLINEIEQESKNNTEIKINNTDEKNKINNNKNESGYYNLNSNIKNVYDLEDYYNIDRITGDGNCLFYSLSNMIFNDMKYYINIRQIICEYYETTNTLNHLYENEKEKNDYIINMKKDKVYGTGLEIETFSNIYKIKIILFTRYITDKKCNKTHSDKVESIIIGNDYEGNFALMLDNYPNNENLNHYSSLRPKSNKNSLNSNRLNEIKNDIINKYPNIEVNEIISGLTGKLIGERKGKSDWNVYEPLSRKNNEKGSFDYYTVNKINWNYNIKSKYVNYADLVECINLSEIIEEFNAENIKIDQEIMGKTRGKVGQRKGKS